MPAFSFIIDYFRSGISVLSIEHIKAIKHCHHSMLISIHRLARPGKNVTAGKITNNVSP